MVDLNELARKRGLFIDNAATASQNETLIDDGVTREAIELNIVAPLIVEISERDQRISDLEAQLAESLLELREAQRVISGTHKRAVKHENCEITNCPICDGGLFQCADCGAAEIETEQMVCTGLTLEATLSAPKVTEAMREFVSKQSGTDYDIRAAISDRSDIYLTAAQEVDSFDG